MKTILIIIILILTMLNLTNKIPKVPKETATKFSEFRNKEKFVRDDSIFYPGIGDPTMRPILNEKINFAADRFEEVSQSQNPTKENYEEAISKGLANFSDIYINLDTEDRERVCHYFEELMDIVGLESSNGQLNKFMYGFDLNEKINNK